jgi:hypothetical protein
MSTRELRDEILARVRRGEMSTKTAEDWAAENGEIFSTKPDPARFDPMTERLWTLPMAASWIIERSGENVREQWDSYRSEWRDWESLGRPDFGSELRAVGPANLDVFGQRVDPLEDDMRPFANEMCFALRSRQLSATGVSHAQKVRVPISEFAWNGPFHGVERKTRPDAIYAVDAEASFDERIYREVRVPRDEVIGIWAPLAPPWIPSPTTVGERIPTVRLAPTLPPGFDRPDWSVEHVLAWLAHPNLAELRTLELTNPQRPKFYGRIYRRGFIDARPGEILRGALITEKLIAMKGENLVRPGGYWRDKSIWNTQGIWFRSDHVMQLWPERDSQRAQVIEEGRRSEDDAASRGKSGAPQRGRTDDGRSPLKGDDPFVSAARRPGPRPKKLEAVKGAMRKALAEGKLTREGLHDALEKQLVDDYKVSRDTARKAREAVLSEYVGNSNIDN